LPLDICDIAYFKGPYSYEHIITGTRRSRPEDEAVGGILADEMGLGKTLTMLAAIADSISASQEFRQENSFSTKPQSRATIVIAPSVGKCLVPSPAERPLQFQSLTADIVVLEEWLSDIQECVTAVRALEASL